MSNLSLAERLAAVSEISTLALTHYGRKTGKPYRVTIWFVVEGDKMYLGTLNADRQWTRNVMKRPEVQLQIGAENFSGKVTVITDRAERERVMELFRRKYLVARIFFPILGPLLGLFQDRRAAFNVALDS